MKKNEEIQKHLYNQFGLNAGYVADIYTQFEKEPKSVSEFWQNYFNGLDPITNKTKTQLAEQNIKLEAAPKPNLGETKITDIKLDSDDVIEPIVGVGARIIQNMEESLSIPTATSQRTILVKLLEENRRIINYHLTKLGENKISYSHIVAYAIVKAIRNYPDLNNSFIWTEGKPQIIKREYVNLGIAVDMIKKDGSRSLIVPNIKKSSRKNFFEFRKAYDELVNKARTGKIEPDDFQGTTISLTNPGGIGTVTSIPRLMVGQGCILAIGAIDYPAEFKAMSQTSLASLGVGKVMNITNTYDHRIIQGAASGEFLRLIDNLLRGNDNFYQNIFNDLKIPQMPVSWGVDNNSRSFKNNYDSEEIEKQSKIQLLVNIYRVRGHLIANLNPLSYRSEYYRELDPASYGFTIWDYERKYASNVKGLEKATLREILDTIQQTYCEMVGAEFMHIQHPEEKEWLMNRMEEVRNKPPVYNETKKRILKMLIVAESFEHYLHTKFIGHKRFSLEGSETLIPVLDFLLGVAADDEVDEIFFGMAHRGRLNVLANIIGKTYHQIFSEFEDVALPNLPQGSGDVKYHLGATGNYKTYNKRNLKVSIAPNPSHLEFVSPVVEGIVRAKQKRSNDKGMNKVIPVLMHGDAAFAGQGVVAETLNLSQLKGYRTGGTVHIIINNQIGFTTPPEDARSSPYPTDVAKMVQAPIFHVNGDDPEASIWVTKLAFEYRQKFKKDVIIDLFGYRRHGHNEGDDPIYTQPLMYKKIKTKPSVTKIYSEKLVANNIISEEEIKDFTKLTYECMNESLEDVEEKAIDFKPDIPLALTKEEIQKVKANKITKIDREKLKNIILGLNKTPNNFTLNPKLKKIFDKRELVLDGKEKIDWALGEALAFSSLLLDKFPVRLSGQDSARGTFSQRHLILTDMNEGEEIIPMNSLSPDQALIEPLDSHLSESAVMGFDYGYSAADPLTLVMWEAQFGDFANGAQVIIDNFISASEVKWNLPNNIVLLLPHGQEGQGPEHSSARLERFLILCAKNNMIVANPTTPAQYFHLLRKQVLGRIDKPLIIFTPKSLLRLPAARSEITDFTSGTFNTIINDSSANIDNIKRVILTSGKVYYDLLKYKEENNIIETAIIRVEQYYPFDKDLVLNYLKSYKNAKKYIWVQEEPQNMGAWNFIFMRLYDSMPNNKKLEYCGRDESPSPAFGSNKIFTTTQNDLVKRAFS
jgi:2-oxoglutarate dehydrogenase E1 component